MYKIVDNLLEADTYQFNKKYAMTARGNLFIKDRRNKLVF